MSESDASLDVFDDEADEENVPPVVFAPHIQVVVNARYLDFQENPEYCARLKKQAERRRRLALQNALKAKRRFVF